MSGSRWTNVPGKELGVANTDIPPAEQSLLGLAEGVKVADRKATPLCTGQEGLEAAGAPKARGSHG